MSKAQPKAKPVEVQKLTYVEGEMIAAGGRSVRACWLADKEDEAVCVVTSGADFERSRRALKGAALATQAFEDLLAVCKLLVHNETKADGVLGLVDNPHVKALRASADADRAAIAKSQESP